MLINSSLHTKRLVKYSFKKLNTVKYEIKFRIMFW